MSDLIPLTVTSYNCRGLNSSKFNYIRLLLQKTNVLFLQEHWLSEGQLSKLGDIDEKFLFTAVSGFDNKDILSGRPYGGCAILWRSDMKINVEIIETNSRRICAVKITACQLRMLLINVYMPHEGDTCMTDEFADQLSIIESIIDNNSDRHVVVGGDFNVDLHRAWTHTAMLDSFCMNLGLNISLRHAKCQIDYSYNFNMSRFNVLDHFLLSDMLFDKSIDSISVSHDVDNLSDHEPILLKLLLNVQCIGFADKIYTPRVSWAKATDDNLREYQAMLTQTLQRIELPTDALLCKDMKCSSALHFQQVNEYALAITKSCLSSAETAIPHTCRRQASGRIAGWSEYVQPLRDKSLFWHKIWLDCGRPKVGAVAESMRRTRAAYHYAIRRIRKNEDSIISERIADAMLHNNTRDFWSEIKRIRTSKLCNNCIVDGQSEHSDIVKLFAVKYRELYSSVPYDADELQCISNDVNNLILTELNQWDCFWSCNDVKTAVSHLKKHKSDGNLGLTSDHIINAGDVCFTHIAMLFTAIIIHGRVPESFLHSTIVPIPKQKNGNRTDSSNYRGIALSSIFGKIFDNVVLVRYSSYITSSELQFGFKARSSTNLCTMVMKETIAYYVHNHSPVFCTFLDATKAFDRLHYCKMFRALIERQLPASILRVLINFYTGNYVRISWCGLLSDYFLAVNGVKQGGVLSPVLYCLYIDGLLQRLSRAGVGCVIGNNYVGVLAYADDIVLLAPTASALRTMLAVCDRYANEYTILFNANKTKCLVILPGSRRFLHEFLTSCTFYIGGKPIEFVESFTHLGHLITNRMDDSADILERRSNFIGQTNNMLCHFGKLNPYVRNRLFQSYCTSLYGCELWQLNNERIGDLCTTWRKSLRRVWNLPYMSHSYLLPILSQCLPIFDEICRRSSNFIYSCLNNESNLVRSVATHGLNYGRYRSPLGFNALFCAERYSCDVADIVAGKANNVIHNYICNLSDDSQMRTACFVRELVYVRDNILILSNQSVFVRDDLDDIIYYVCTS